MFVKYKIYSLNNLWVKEEVTVEIRKYFEKTNARENMCGIPLKSYFGEKYIALNAFIRQEQRLKINDLRIHLKNLVKD